MWRTNRRLALRPLQVVVWFLVRVIPPVKRRAGYIINVIMALSDITTRIQVEAHLVKYTHTIHSLP